MLLYRDPKQLNKKVAREKNTPLHYAVLYLQKKCVHLLVGAGASKLS